MALLLGLPSQEAPALGLGRPQVHSPLGKPLDVSVPLTLADGERLTDSCMRAEVVAGDARVPAGLLQLRLEGEPGQQYLRLQSQARIDEPTLRITLALGCPLRLTREFNVFVDPPTQLAVAPSPSLPPPPVPLFVPPTAVEAAPRPQADLPVAPPRPRLPARPRPAGPRLTLDRPEVLVAEVLRPAKPATRAPEMELTPEIEAQISQLEQTVAQLRTELLARQQAEAQAASAASQAQPAASAVAPAPAPESAAVVHGARTPPYREPMTWLLTLAMSLLAGSAAFYLSRWRDQRARGELAYWRALHAAEGAGGASTTPVPGATPSAVGLAPAFADESQHQITQPQPRPMPWPPAAAAPDTGAAQPSPIQAATAPLLSSELSIADELLDLQQQVDFLHLLGQHEAAADLLAGRLARGQGGAMPYLLLLELGQQRGDAEVFAEQARQFEQRFGRPAPQWAQSLSHGRSLDGCPSVIARLQMAWADPAAAMKLLQELLAQGGGPGVPRFDLPAYRDLLMLYGVARDLFEAGLRSDEVDLMLPMDAAPGG
ncbi:hypothetical protein [Roseateles sp.]|uniref:type IV pilus assembly protein FimV n=1 Tax=Roseateles sp. TaxID=1971397 RepID=UPI0025DF92D6|nr:hypothetical protein [Roseateles sp.]MBV8034025.1 hypothetical protein [Roseateles sp.]